LGICLGMHLLFSSSEESPKVKGLGIFKGKVDKFRAGKELKVPHMGWNQLKIKDDRCPLFKDLAQDGFVYFCHSYYPLPKIKEIIAATTQYGIDFASIIWQDNIFATQFHPEKSQDVGLKILENFVRL
jgi:glutamine amidotransferase